MGNFIVAGIDKIQLIKDFIDKNIESCFFMQQGLYESKGILKKSFEDNIKYYAYIENDNVEGLIFLNKSNVMIPYFTNDRPYKKLDLLKIVKYHNPVIIRGELDSIDKIFKVIERVMPLYDSKKCSLMRSDSPSENNYFEDKIYMGKEINFNSAVDFLIGAEQAFSRNPLSINQLKNKILKNDSGSDYYFILKNEKVVTQGLIEYSVDNYSLIGGIYTSKKYRRNGHGKIISTYIKNKVFESGNIPFLIVEDENLEAKNIYNDIGFYEIKKYKELILKKI